MKKAIAALLALLLWVSCLGLTAQAVEVTEETDGTEPTLSEEELAIFEQTGRIFENMDQRKKNPMTRNPEEYWGRYIPMYKGTNMWLHLKALDYYYFPPIFDTGDILPIDVKNHTVLFEKTGIYSNSKVKAAVELISVDETVPYRLVILTLKDQKDTKSVAQEMVYNININLNQWDNAERLNAGVFGAHGEITMIVLDETLFDSYYPTYIELGNTYVETYVNLVELYSVGSYDENDWTYFSWKLPDK